MALNVQQKGHLFTVGELKQEEGISLCSALAGNMQIRQLKFLSISTNDHKSTTGIDLGITNTLE